MDEWLLSVDVSHLFPFPIQTQDGLYARQSNSLLTSIKSDRANL